MSLTFYSPAKVNLFFKVLSKRKDGYHNIFSLYQAISLVDHLFINKAKKDSFFCFNNKDLIFDENNLIIKALRLFRKKTNILDPVEIYLKKNIPIEAGLGGGSSNAATTLFALNELFEKPLHLFELIELSKNIGADASFFFSKGTALCENIGDIFENISSQDLNFHIAKPNFGMSTKSVYENVDLNFLDKTDPSVLKSAILRKKEIKFFNDLEVSAFKLNEKLQETKTSLEKMGFEKVVMTGSGSCFMCFGRIKPISTKKIQFFSVFNIQRNLENWYSF
ncbi:MAG: 4-diphosphocytidyl-2-C-methyl-D-erythritol kinase [Candidatus Anoxychlamydiales bacterium]|nr:4-diphosphocytidyl-2-C-methyl-D-erythritol kinase [Candidatus Anoxychlamydiales bacterium]